MCIASCEWSGGGEREEESWIEARTASIDRKREGFDLPDLKVTITDEAATEADFSQGARYGNELLNNMLEIILMPKCALQWSWGLWPNWVLLPYEWKVEYI